MIENYNIKIKQIKLNKLLYVSTHQIHNLTPLFREDDQTK